jgi:hypothetical protein
MDAVVKLMSQGVKIHAEDKYATPAGSQPLPDKAASGINHGGPSGLCYNLRFLNSLKGACEVSPRA